MGPRLHLAKAIKCIRYMRSREKKKTRSIISKLFYQRYYRMFLLVKTHREIMDCLSQDLECEVVRYYIKNITI